MGLAVTLDEARAFLRLGGTAADALVGTLVAGCEEWVQEFCGVQFGEVRRCDALDGGGRNLRLERRPLRQVISVADRESPGVAFIADVDYSIVGERLLKRPSASYGAWAGRLEQIAERWAEGQGRWLVTYDCGYQAVESGTTTTSGAGGSPHIPLPAGLRVAVLELVRRAFDNRGGASSEGAASWKVDWQSFAESDVVEWLGPYMRVDG